MKAPTWDAEIAYLDHLREALGLDGFAGVEDAEPRLGADGRGPLDARLDVDVLITLGRGAHEPRR